MRTRRAILYVNEAVVRGLFQLYFSSKGYEVLALSEPAVCPVYGEALTTCAKMLPCADIMVVDHYLPRMAGADLILAQFEHGCKLTARNKALIAGDADQARLEPVLRLGSACFQRPFPVNQLEGWIDFCEQRMDLAQPLSIIRKEERLPYSQEVLCEARDGVLIRGQSVNISLSGLCVKLPLRLQPDEVVRFHSALPFPTRRGAVRWAGDAVDGWYLTGLQCP